MSSKDLFARLSRLGAPSPVRYPDLHACLSQRRALTTCSLIGKTGASKAPFEGSSPSGWAMTDANDFYEDDEPIEDINAAWEAGIKGVTSSKHNLPWWRERLLKAWASWDERPDSVERASELVEADKLTGEQFGMTHIDVRHFLSERKRVTNANYEDCINELAENHRENQ